jgi:hypothetical protein
MSGDDGWVFTGRLRWFAPPKRFPVLQQEFRKEPNSWAILLVEPPTEWRDVPEVEE